MSVPLPVPPRRIRIVTGIPEVQLTEAARLYWRGFARQILPVWVPPLWGEALIRHAAHPDRALAALGPDGALIGMAGLRDSSGGFTQASTTAYRAAFGICGTPLRTLSEALYRIGPDSPDMLIDGLVVAKPWRRQGIAAALIRKAVDQAARNGYPGLRVEFSADNSGAESLYHALGFQPVTQARMGWPWNRPTMIMRLPVMSQLARPASPSPLPEA